MDNGVENCRILNVELGTIINGDTDLPNGDVIRPMEKGEIFK